MSIKHFVPPDLPINACLDDLAEALESSHVILSASTGSGKTTIVPISLLNQPWLVGKKIIMLEPRRPAARMAAHRMAYLLGEKTGNTVGYQVRFDRQISSDTRVEVLTEGLLLKRLQSDPELSGVGLIIFDEFHERSLVADVSLALCIDVCHGLRDDLRLLIMSATLDTARLAQLLNAKTITAPGYLHPVTVHYARHDFPLNDAVEACLPLVDQALDLVEADVLVFLPGRKEISQMQALAEEKWHSRCEIFTLYGDLSPERQDQVLTPTHKKQR
ncbi:MAG: DEAD/DEAH box helicase [Gammaproteobacteria bacterium]